LFVGLAMASLLIAYAGEIVRLLYGMDQFAPAVPVLQVFGFVVLVRYTVELPAVLLTAAKRQHIRMVLVIGATLLNFAANAYAIPHFGALGAACVSLATNLVLGMGYMIAGRDLIDHRWLSADRVLPTVATVAMTAAVIGLQVPMWLGVPVLLAGVLTVCSFVGLSGLERARVFRRSAI